MIAAKKRRPGAGPEKYRGVDYSVAKQSEGTWVWKVQPQAERGTRPISGQSMSGTTRLGQNEAVEAAHRAIDKLLGTTRK